MSNKITAAFGRNNELEEKRWYIFNGRYLGFNYFEDLLHDRISIILSYYCY